MDWDTHYIQQLTLTYITHTTYWKWTLEFINVIILIPFQNTTFSNNQSLYPLQSIVSHQEFIFAVPNFLLLKHLMFVCFADTNKQDSALYLYQLMKFYKWQNSLKILICFTCYRHNRHNCYISTGWYPATHGQTDGLATVLVNALPLPQALLVCCQDIIKSSYIIPMYRFVWVKDGSKPKYVKCKFLSCSVITTKHYINIRCQTMYFHIYFNSREKSNHFKTVLQDKYFFLF